MPVAIRNIMGLSVLVFLESLHILVLIVTIFNFFPVKIDPEVWQRYFQFLYSAIKPEREIFFYRSWVVLAIVGQGVVLWWFRKKLEDPLLLGRLRSFMINEAVLLSLLLFCVFKGLLYPDAGWVKWIFYTVLVLSWGVRIFWPETVRFVKYCWPRLIRVYSMSWLVDGLFCGLIFLLLYMPDLDATLARIFIRDKFYHMDSFIMAPGSAYLSGAQLNIDLISQYSTVGVMFLTNCARLLGGFSYIHVLALFMGIVIVYFMALYLLSRHWLKSPALALAGTLLVIKFQMMHWGVAPLVWQYPSATAVRCFLDIIFLSMILAHIRYGGRRWLYGMQGVCGFALAYMTDTGLYMLIAFYAYLFLLALQERRWAFFVGQAIIAPLIAFGIMFISVGPNMISATYWRNAGELMGLFLSGVGTLPIYQNLKEGNFFAFFLGLSIPLVYLGTLLNLGATRFLVGHKRGEDVFVIVLSVYGLAQYHYFIGRSALSSYHAVDLAFVLILMYWIHHFLIASTAVVRAWVNGAILFLCLGALLTNHLFTYYPNVLNMAQDDLLKGKAYYQQEFHFEDDVALIQRHTLEGEKAPLLSSFETKILLDAKRKPFFYYFPLLHSCFMAANDFDGTYLHTKARAERTFAQLETEKPPYIFVERKIFMGQISPEFYQKFVTLKLLMEYVRAHYVEVDQGKYLLALRRKE